MRLVPLLALALALALAACSSGGGNNGPQAQCERQADEDPAVMAIVQQPWVDTYKLAFAKREALQQCLRKKGVAMPGGVQPVRPP